MAADVLAGHDQDCARGSATTATPNAAGGAREGRRRVAVVGAAPVTCTNVNRNPSPSCPASSSPHPASSATSRPARRCSTRPARSASTSIRCAAAAASAAAARCVPSRFVPEVGDRHRRPSAVGVDRHRADLRRPQGPDARPTPRLLRARAATSSSTCPPRARSTGRSCASRSTSATSRSIPIVHLAYIELPPSVLGDAESMTDLVVNDCRPACRWRSRISRCPCCTAAPGALEQRPCGHRRRSRRRRDRGLARLRRPALGVAVDVGSTTVAGHLCDLATGEVLASSGRDEPADPLRRRSDEPGLVRDDEPGRRGRADAADPRRTRRADRRTRRRAPAIDTDAIVARDSTRSSATRSCTT